MNILIDQPTALPTRKVMAAFVSGLVTVALTQSVPALFPDFLAHPAVSPLWAFVVNGQALIPAAVAYLFRERA